MRRVQALGAVFGVLVVCTVGATSAFAADEWLLGGNLVPLGHTNAVVTTGTWLLLALSFGGFVRTHVVCMGVLLGYVGGLNATGHGTDVVTEIHNLNLTQLKTITCTVLLTNNENGPCSTDLGLLTALNLPWLSELVLKTGDTKPRDLLTAKTGAPGFKVSCVSGTGTFEESCEGNLETEQLTNTGKGVTGEIVNQLGNSCQFAGNVFHVYGTGEVVESLKGETLAIG